SRLAAWPWAADVALHRWVGIWQHQVDAFVALSEFRKQLMTQGGLPPAKLHVKPNFYAGDPLVAPFQQRLDYVVFVGRLGQEKGVHTLIESWRRWGQKAPELRLIGDGPLREQLQK